MASFHGSGANETYVGTLRADYIFGGAGDDELYGGGGNDYFDDGLGVDDVYGGAGDDWVTRGSQDGFDQWYGGDGFDTADFSPQNGLNYTINLQIGEARLGDSVDVQMFGFENVVLGDGNDQAIGNHLANLLEGGAGDDTLQGFADNDVLVGGTGDDFLQGGDGIDWASYFFADNRVTVDLNVSVQQNTGGAGLDTLIGIENLEGSNGFSDTLYGDEANNLIRGFGFHDSIRGRLGNDRLEGGGGNDTLDGGGGNDLLFGEAGRDTATYYYAPGAVTVSLGAVGFQDTGAAGQDNLNLIENLNGSNGYGDRLVGNGEANLIRGYGGDDRITGGVRGDTLYGGNGADTFVYASVGDSDNFNGTGFDRIADYGSADRLDLSAIDANGVAAGEGAFTRVTGVFTAAGQLRLVYDMATNTTRVELNTDGGLNDAEAVILLTGNHTAASTDDGWVM